MLQKDTDKLFLLSISHFFHRHLLWFLIAAYVIAVILPVPGLWIRDVSFGEINIFQHRTSASLLMIMLAILMFNAGLGLRCSHVKDLMQKKYLLLAGLAANLIIPIIYIYGMTIAMRRWYEPFEVQYILVGLALVAAMPIAGSSTTWAQNSNGNLALSLGLVFFSIILSPIVTPVAFDIFSEMASEEYEKVLRGLAAYGSGGFLGIWVVLPSLLGIATRLMISKDWQTRGVPYLKLINAAVLLLLNYSNASVSLPQAMAEHDFDFLAITLVITAGLCLTLFAAGHGLGRLFKLNRAEDISLMFGLGMNNNGTGLVLASLALSSYPNIMVPIIFYNLVQHIVAGAVHEAMSRKENNLGTWKIGQRD
ncbi:bile acid:Na+ symporter, BASS family [Nitrosospira multiformis]|uniref:Bile acid:Na+ symporter, BASS family n=1 Tax=Nitrosospira multiformis TaxID=1231 RepID=A0A1I0GAQ4_9PROT|nr:bile acid:sodium symporter [Nitrosospira multiformis]SET67120.1 bile acid:Na+ symporter, BASS family [Nitrosospira multiformis]